MFPLISALLILSKTEKVSKRKVLNGYLINNKNQFPQDLFFECGTSRLNYSFKNWVEHLHYKKDY